MSIWLFLSIAAAQPASASFSPASGSPAQEDSAGANSTSEWEIEQVRIGIDNHYKIGFWVPLSVTLSSVAPSDQTAYFVAPDGDGNETLFPLRAVERSDSSESPIRLAGLVKIGRAQGIRSIRWIDSDGIRTKELNINSAVEWNAIDSTSRLFVTLGRVEELNNSLGRTQSNNRGISVVQVEDSSQLPTHWMGWEFVDRLLLSYTDSEWEQELTAVQVDAIHEWVQQGGEVIICIGGTATEVLNSENLASRLVPGSFDSVVEHAQSAGFETYALSNDQLLGIRGESIEICKLNEVTGSIEAFEGRNERDLPLVIRSPRGLGRVVFVTFDINEERFLNWPGRTRFLAKVFEREQKRSDGGNSESGGGRVSHIGYTDLSGQLRSALDRFAGVQLITFTWVAILIVLFILCIGPGDYFLLKKVFKRMEFTWVTFAVIVMLFCVSVVITTNLTKGKDVRVNQVEIIDIDVTSSTVRGSVWATVYSPRSARYEIAIDEEKVAQPFRMQDSLISWQGLPGSGLGGMDSTVSPSASGEPYRFDMKQDGGQIRSQLEAVPIQVAATKTFFGRWSGSIETKVFSELEVDRRNDSLSGSVTNPLDFELTRVVVIFGSWAYVFDNPIAAGETVDLEREATERTLDGFLTRREVLEGQDITTPWDPTDIDVHRIVEMLMFHEAAGGKEYTSLTQRFHAPIDLSSHLTSERAMMIGLGPSRATTMKVNGDSSDNLYGESSTYYRFVLPVANPEVGNTR